MVAAARRNVVIPRPFGNAADSRSDFCGYFLAPRAQAMASSSLS